MKGISFLKVLSGEKESLYNESEYIAPEMQNGKWVRKGNFKAQFVPKPYDSNEWKLYDLSDGPGVITDLASSKPELLKGFIAEWENMQKKLELF